VTIHNSSQSRMAMASLAQCWCLGKYGRKEMNVSSRMTSTSFILVLKN
jgi:hypothetical protein